MQRLLILLLCVFILTGCRTTLVVRNATVKDITPILKDYAGIRGYAISYQNEQTNSYRLDLGSVYIPYTSETVKTTVTLPTENIQPLTSYEQKTWRTVAAEGRNIQAAVMIRLVQQNNDVLISLNSDDEVGPARYQVGYLSDYLRDFGYTVEQK